MRSGSLKFNLGVDVQNKSGFEESENRQGDPCQTTPIFAGLGDTNLRRAGDTPPGGLAAEPPAGCCVCVWGGGGGGGGWPGGGGGGGGGQSRPGGGQAENAMNFHALLKNVGCSP